jgi:hypothetical protein
MITVVSTATVIISEIKKRASREMFAGRCINDQVFLPVPIG